MAGDQFRLRILDIKKHISTRLEKIKIWSCCYASFLKPKQQKLGFVGPRFIRLPVKSYEAVGHQSS